MSVDPHRRTELEVRTPANAIRGDEAVCVSNVGDPPESIQAQSGP